METIKLVLPKGWNDKLYLEQREVYQTIERELQETRTLIGK